jgi:sulfite reductase beta subunit-like hemoprotein
LHAELYDIDDYRRYFYAISNAQAVEGSIVADLVMAAQRVRNLAKEKNSPIHKEKLWDIAQALTTVMRRYNESRKDRKARALTAGNGHEGGEA